MPRIPQPELREFAPPPADPWAAAVTAGRRLPEAILRSEGRAGLGGVYAGGAYALFEEMEDKDAHLAALLQTRKLGVLARPRKIEPAAAGPAEARLAAWVEGVLGTLPGWNAALLHLLGALGHGMAALEIIWGFDAAGRLVPAALKPRAAGRFTWNAARAQWHLADPADPLAPGRPLPPRKFIFLLCGATDARPYGKGLCEKVYWQWWFKKHNVKFWLAYNEKFGAPTIVARHRAGLSDAERARLLEVIDAIQTDAGVTLPEGITLELLEASRSGNGGETYRALAQWCNDEIARAVLGQTLTSGEGARSGSLALGQVHEGVRQDTLRADAWALMDAVNTTLVRWLVDLNFGEDVPAPRWLIDLAPELDLGQEVAIDRQLLQMGVPLPVGYFYEKYGRPSPAGEAARLQYDDSNLYQYHLQFGILTINEVRRRLGLFPVPWGDQPTSPVETHPSPPTPPGSTGEATLEDNGKTEAAKLRAHEK